MKEMFVGDNDIGDLETRCVYKGWQREAEINEYACEQVAQETPSLQIKTKRDSSARSLKSRLVLIIGAAWVLPLD